MKLYKLILITNILLLLTQTLSAQQKSDTVIVRQIVTEFYEWYTNAISLNNSDEYNPNFTSDSSGKTTLSFEPYFDNLRKYGFSESLILKERESHQTCIDNIKQIDYKDFFDTFTELDQFEESGCDFFNSYRWTGTMEPIDGVSIKYINLKNDTADVKIQYFSINPDKTKYLWNNETVVELVKVEKMWKINELK